VIKKIEYRLIHIMIIMQLIYKNYNLLNVISTENIETRILRNSEAIETMELYKP
jgi:hypothetical protein